MAKVVHKVRKHISAMKQEILKQMLVLSTGAFSLVAALAWNELIKEVIDSYLQPLIGGHSGVISLLIYAVLVTLLAVFVTYSLTKLVKKD
jgi:uncharacterized membrane protein (DUF106 family)